MLSRSFKAVVALGCLAFFAGCTTPGPFLPSSGPSEREVASAPDNQSGAGISVIEVSDAVVRRVLASQRRSNFAEVFGSGAASPYTIGAGDSLEISVWEAPPAALFGSAVPDLRGMNTSSRVAVLPEQVVDSQGDVNMPFAGSIPAVGRSPQELEREIVRRLKGKANDPQVLVRVLRNVSGAVTVVGEVNTSTRMPLTPHGERLLDALASAGGVRQPVGKITLQVTREVNEQGQRSARVASLPLDAIITDPAQNIALQPGDVITALHQPNSFTVLGATVRNEEINFEAQGITLAQALGRAGGLQDQRANATGVFIFHLEDPAALADAKPGQATADGRVPVVYQVDLRDPATFFAAQAFPIRNKDVMYVSNAPAAELQKFLNLISSVLVPTLTIRNLSN